MRWNGMPMAMWAVFAKSFEKQLTEVFGYDAKTAKAIRKTAKLKYKEIIAKLPEFEKGDQHEHHWLRHAGGVRSLYAEAAGYGVADGIL